ncbi:MAG: anhydro-N-acetylmuramic acid kinase [Cyanosarcina radialis HA8281-LM2]|jgi:anhydro-N-acetylmuramic acid kinase|nr:anhydro-N-acetylmuramic acid kinase [Cyanosarcina radialis HA8281-LM2]
MTRVIGSISGTSVDGIDTALVEIVGTDIDLKIELLSGATYPYPEALKNQILAVCAGENLSMAQLAELDDAIAYRFAQAAIAIQDGHQKAELIGSHGQTVYHRPPELVAGEQGSRGAGENFSLNTQHSTLNTSKHSTLHKLGYSLQLGRGEVIAQLTGIPTISNFRVGDIAVGGHGAPLVSKVDAYLLGHPTRHRCVQNIGGIGNLTYLPARDKFGLEGIVGWDTGPGNSLLDIAVQHLSEGKQTYDRDGAWAASGTPCQALVSQWLQHEYFQVPPPKSTGRELFGWDYWQQCLADAQSYNLNPADLLATIAELTAASIVDSYQKFLPQMPDEVLLCGGGSRNLYLKKRLAELFSARSSHPVAVMTTDDVGLSADYKEAIAFAVLAYWRNLGIPGNLPEVTNAREPVLLGYVNK